MVLNYAIEQHNINQWQEGRIKMELQDIIPKERLFITKAQTIVSEWDIKKAANIIFGMEIADKDLDVFISNCQGIDCEIDADMPNEDKIMLLLRYDETVKAIRVFYKSHDCSLKEARDRINNLHEALKKAGGVQ